MENPPTLESLHNAVTSLQSQIDDIRRILSIDACQIKRAHHRMTYVEVIFAIIESAGRKGVKRGVLIAATSRISVETRDAYITALLHSGAIVARRIKPQRGPVGTTYYASTHAPTESKPCHEPS